jgi:hypothetical protein
MGASLSLRTTVLVITATSTGAVIPITTSATTNTATVSLPYPATRQDEIVQRVKDTKRAVLGPRRSRWG